MTNDVETDQGCCGTTAEGATDEGGIETDQGCCGDGSVSDEGPRSEIRNDCCDDRTTSQSSCGGAATGASSGSAATTVPPNRKSRYEIERIRSAAERTDSMLDAMADAWQPDWTEADVSDHLHDAADRAGLDTAWTRNYCPAVHAGPDAGVGHSPPTDRTLSPGALLHVDFGVTFEGYVADLQRVYYYPDGPDETVPDDLRGAADDVRAAIEAGLAALEPGVAGHAVDAAARTALTDRGWSAFDHAFGHQVGELAHDEGTLLGPRWDRYGENPTGAVRADEVYSVELGVGTTYGYVGLEEMVVVREDDVEPLVDPQTEVRLLGDT